MAKPTTIPKLGANLAPAARAHIEQRLAAVKSYSPTAGLLYGLEEGCGSWSVTALAPETVNDYINFYAKFGAGVQFELDGIAVIIGQIGRVKLLDAGTLELRHNRLWNDAA